MIVPGRSHRELAAGVAPILTSWCEEVVPAQVDPLPNCPYSPSYTWMFAHEKRLKYLIESATGWRLGPIERELFGPDGAYSEALSNAFVHGHRRNRGLAILLTCSVGRRGLAFTITDRGEGFDVDSVVEAAQRGTAYYSFAGNGLRTLAQQRRVTASFADGGRTVHVAFDWDT